MPTLNFSHDAFGSIQISCDAPNLPNAITNSIQSVHEVQFKVHHFNFDQSNDQALSYYEQNPFFFEWQRIDFFFDATKEANEAFRPPYQLYINNQPTRIQSRKSQNVHKLTGNVTLENAVGLSSFSIKDSKQQTLFKLDTEVFPQKMDYKEDFQAMISEISEVTHNLTFDYLKKTYSNVELKNTKHQSLNEWLAILKVLFEEIEFSLDLIIRSPHSKITTTTQTKEVSRVRRATRKTEKWIQKNQKYLTKGNGLKVTKNFKTTHLPESKKFVSYNTFENRFLVWATRQLIKKLELVIKLVSKSYKQAEQEIQLLKGYRQKLLFRLSDQIFQSVEAFEHQTHFSTVLNMGAGYRDFYHRFLLLQKGLSFAENDVFKLDFKDIATLYEYWCFIKTIQLLKQHRNYDLSTNDLIKTEHTKLAIGLKKGKTSEVKLTRKDTGEKISIRYNGSFPTPTFTQKPDHFIEFHKLDNKYPGQEIKPFKYVMDAKYRFDKGSQDYPDTQSYGPPLDAIAQLHRYRDAMLWDKNTDEHYKTAIKNLGGIILFPYPEDEEMFREHRFYQSLKEVNIGAIPLHPGKDRENKLYIEFLDELFHSSTDTLQEEIIHYDRRAYDQMKEDIDSPLLIGLLPKKDIDKRKAFLDKHKIFFNEWPKNSKYSLDQITKVAIYNQATQRIEQVAEVERIEIDTRASLTKMGADWPSRKPDAQLILYYLKEPKPVNLPFTHMSRNGRFITTVHSFNLAIEHSNENFLHLTNPKLVEKWRERQAKKPDLKIFLGDSISDEEDTKEVSFV